MGSDFVPPVASELVTLYSRLVAEANQMAALRATYLRDLRDYDLFLAQAA